jgi:hypothetical protein
VITDNARLGTPSSFDKNFWCRHPSTTFHENPFSIPNMKYANDKTISPLCVHFTHFVKRKQTSVKYGAVAFRIFKIFLLATAVFRSALKPNSLLSNEYRGIFPRG